jgi:hypothetical protein
MAVIYMVEHVFSLPELEQEWNDTYTAQIRIMLGVPGFRTGQRFKAIGNAMPPRYIALYQLDSAAVFESAPYKKIGGGGTWSARFRPAYQLWVRNLFETEAAAPAVGSDQGILVFDAAKPGSFPPASQKPLWLKSAGLHMTTPYRALTVLSAADAKAASTGGQGICYAPVTPQLT